MIETQFERKIKVFQSDGGGEFTSLKFKEILAHSSIIHHMSCPDIPQQNRVAERKHRHVVETGFTLIFNQTFLCNY